MECENLLSKILHNKIPLLLLMPSSSASQGVLNGGSSQYPRAAGNRQTAKKSLQHRAKPHLQQNFAAQDSWAAVRGEKSTVFHELEHD